MKDTCQLNDFLKGLKPEYGKQVASLGKRIMFLVDERNFLPDIAVEIDRDIVKKILDVLVGNAIKYTDKGYIKIGYKVLDNNMLQIFVEDTGLGFDPVTLETITKKLDGGVFSGTAGNLTESAGLANTINGKIRIESQKDMGTTVYFSVQLTAITLDGGSEDASETVGLTEFSQKPKPNGTNDIWQGKTILIAEDEIVNYMFLEVLFEETGAMLIHASDGQEAIDFAAARPEINLILMDIKMPHVNGLEATKAIKSTRPQVPIIAQTAYAMQDDEYKALQAGCNEYISKPIDANKLLGLVKKYLA
jgi:CheY-like chemotaxis protein